MLDNCLFKDYKILQTKLMRKLPEYLIVTPGEKEECATEAWEQLPKENILGYWRKCGYDTRSKRKITITKTKPKKVQASLDSYIRNEL